MPLPGGQPVDAASLAEREHGRRSASVEEAQELLRKGDEAYRAGRFSDAVEAYAGARELIPDAPLTAELRQSATDRYVQASIEHARLLSRKGDVAGAKAAVDKVLIDGVAPKDPAALGFRAQLDDPIRTNPALTADFAKDVDQVRRLLYTAEGAFSLGKFDEADLQYKEVLRIDPTNSAARRGMEQVAVAKSAYHQSARDQTRGEMLSQTESQWELQVPAPVLGVGPEEPGGPPSSSGTMSVSAKLDRIIIPKVALDQSTLGEALEFLRFRAAEFDVLEQDPARKGVNFTVNLGDPDSDVAKNIRSLKFNLQLSQVPLSRVLRYLADITRTSFTTDDFSVIITPANTTSSELISRTYHVPPDFISSLSNGKEGKETKDDPFAAAPAKEGLLTKRLSAKDALVKQGVSFPEGSNAAYNAATNTLNVLNTAANQDLIAQIVDSMTQTEPVMISVQVTMIKTQKENLDELGFDFLVNPFPVGGDLFGAGGTPGNTPGRIGADFTGQVNGSQVNGVPLDAGALASGVVTNGLRSGDSAISPNGIDYLINHQDRSNQSTAAAPGILSVTGLFSDGQVQAMMRGLGQKKSVDIMAKPSTVTRSGQASTVTIVREFIYPTEYEPPQLPNAVGTGVNSTPVTPSMPTAFSKKDIGISLEVLPVADANKRYVDITLNPVVTGFDGFVNYGSPINASKQGLRGSTTVQLTQNAILMPIFSVERANTQVTVADGCTVAIGGLMTNTYQNVEDKVPVLGDMPLVGRFFSSSARKPTTTALVFLVHVELMDPTGRPFRHR